MTAPDPLNGHSHINRQPPTNPYAAVTFFAFAAALGVVSVCTVGLVIIAVVKALAL